MIQNSKIEISDGNKHTVYLRDIEKETFKDLKNIANFEYDNIKDENGEKVIHATSSTPLSTFYEVTAYLDSIKIKNNSKLTIEGIGIASCLTHPSEFEIVDTDETKYKFKTSETTSFNYINKVNYIEIDNGIFDVSNGHLGINDDSPKKEKVTIYEPNNPKEFVINITDGGKLLVKGDTSIGRPVTINLKGKNSTLSTSILNFLGDASGTYHPWPENLLENMRLTNRKVLTLNVSDGAIFETSHVRLNSELGQIAEIEFNGGTLKAKNTNSNTYLAYETIPPLLGGKMLDQQDPNWFKPNSDALIKVGEKGMTLDIPKIQPDSQPASGGDPILTWHDRPIILGAKFIKTNNDQEDPAITKIGDGDLLLRPDELPNVFILKDGYLTISDNFELGNNYTVKTKDKSNLSLQDKTLGLNTSYKNDNDETTGGFKLDGNLDLTNSTLKFTILEKDKKELSRILGGFIPEQFKFVTGEISGEPTIITVENIEGIEQNTKRIYHLDCSVRPCQLRVIPVTITEDVLATRNNPATGASRALDSLIDYNKTINEQHALLQPFKSLETEEEVAATAIQMVPLLVAAPNQIIRDNVNMISNTISDRTSQPLVKPELQVWAKMIGENQSRRGDYAIQGYQANHKGIVIGADVNQDDYLIGAAVAYTQSDARSKYSALNHKMDVDSATLLAYGQYQLNPTTFIDGQLGMTESNIKGKRELSFIPAQAKSDYKAHTVFAGLGVNHQIELGRYRFTPFIRADFAQIKSKGYQENGADIWSLNVKDSTMQSLMMRVGSRFEMAISPSLTLMGKLALSRDLRAQQGKTTATFQGEPGLWFDTYTSNKPKMLTELEAGVKYTPASTIQVDAVAHTAVGSNQKDIGAQLSVAFKF